MMLHEIKKKQWGKIIDIHLRKQDCEHILVEEMQ